MYSQSVPVSPQSSREQTPAYTNRATSPFIVPAPQPRNWVRTGMKVLAAVGVPAIAHTAYTVVRNHLNKMAAQRAAAQQYQWLLGQGERAVPQQYGSINDK